MVARSCLYIHAVSGLTSGRWAEDGGKQAIASLSAAVKLFAEQGSETTDETANAYFALGSAQVCFAARPDDDDVQVRF
jgi:hypothetical protein